MRNMLRAGAIFFLAWMFCGGMGLDWLSQAHGQTDYADMIKNIRTKPLSPRTGDKIKLLFDQAKGWLGLRSNGPSMGTWSIPQTMTSRTRPLNWTTRSNLVT